MPTPKILIVEDNLPIRNFIRSALGIQGFAVWEAGSSREAIAAATHCLPEVILIDLGLPDRDGIETIKELRQWYRGAVVVLTACVAESSLVTCLDAGADDYITKPFATSELLARLRAVLRCRVVHDGSEKSAVICGHLAIDPIRHRFQIDNVDVHLTPVEFRLMTVLLVHQYRLVTHQQLLSEVWGKGTEHGQYLRVYIHQLRHKIEVDPVRPRRLTTVVGVGYRLVDGEDQS
jgi:two-component system KDP operon response regulator KdpE